MMPVPQCIDQLLKGCRRLRHIPCVAVQGAKLWTLLPPPQVRF